MVDTVGTLVEVGSFVRPAEGETLSGDAVVVVELEDAWVVGLVDGLGHGPGAAAAAARFTAVVRERARDRAPEELLHEADADLRGARGGVGAILRIDAKTAELRFAGVGNIAFAAWTADPMRPVSHAGILGRLGAGRARPFAFPLAAGDLVLLHSDGVSHAQDLGPFDKQTTQEIAREIVEIRGKPADDAACVVVRYGATRLPC